MKVLYHILILVVIIKSYGSAQINSKGALLVLKVICEMVKLEIDEKTIPELTKSMQILHVTQFGYRAHNAYPSAVKSLLKSPIFDPKLPTVIFAHDFLDSVLVSGGSLADAFQTQGKYNVLAINSSLVLNETNYFLLSALVKYTGDFLGNFVHDLTKMGVGIEQVTLIGHGLGAHVCGFAGKTYKSLNNGKMLPRITGLNPPLLCFYDVNTEQRLDRNDAKFVDIIYTYIYETGLNISLGHVEFYPNGGVRIQPGCLDDTCSHNRARMLYEESVRIPEAFLAVQCDSWDSFLESRCVGHEKAVMGFKTPVNVTGTYYLKTKKSPPFGIGEEGLVP